MKNILITSLIAGSLISCKKNDNVDPLNSYQNIETINDPDVDVYEGGYFKKDYLIDVACYWKNGKQFSVSDQSQQSQVFDILVNNGNVYLAGEFNNKPCYWINNERFDITSQGNIMYGFVSRIYLDQGKLYLLGNLNLTNENNSRGFVWTKDGINSPEIKISDTREAYVLDWDFANNHFYVADYVNKVPGYGVDGWDNHTVVDDGLGHPNNICLNNQDIYLSGTKVVSNNEYTWGYWKNGGFSPINLPYLDGYISEMILSPTAQVYQVGNHNKSAQDLAQKAAYWLDGVQNDLVSGNDQSNATDIVLNGTNLYISGFLDGVQGGSGKISAGYWTSKNSWIGFNCPFPAIGTSIYLVKK
jgi:hypothetical protein